MIQKSLFSAAAVALLVLRLRYPSFVPSDAVSFGLLILAFLPWASSLIKAAELPGGWKIEFRELKERVDQQQELINDLVKYSMSASIFTTSAALRSSRGTTTSTMKRIAVSSTSYAITA